MKVLGRFSARAKRLQIAVGATLLLNAPLAAQTVTAPTPPVRNSVDANGVDLMNGRLQILEADLSIGDPANGGLAHTRHWVDAPQPDGAITSGWRHDFLITVLSDSDTGNEIISGGGFSHVFTNPGGTDSAGMGETLTSTSHLGVTTLVYTTHNGTIVNFDNSLLKNLASYTAPTGYLPTTIVKPNGEVLTFTYKSSSYVRLVYGASTTYYVVRLQAVSNNYGYMLKYSYNSNDPNSPDDWLTIGSVSAINLATAYCDPTADSCSGSWPTVSYGTATLLDSGGASYAAQIVTLPSGRTRTYKASETIGHNPMIIAIKDPTSSAFTTEYQYWQDGGSGAYYGSIVFHVKRNAVTYDYAQNTTQNSSGHYIFTDTVTSSSTPRWTGVTDQTLGFLTSIVTDSHGNPGDWASSQSYTYDQYGRIIKSNINNFQMSYVYDARGNITKQYNSAYGPTIKTTATYDTSCANPKKCNKPNSVTDYLGNTTNITYDATHGGVLTVTAPPAASGGVQPQTRTSYTQLFAYYKNSSGSIVAASAGVYKPTSTSACITTASCAGTADEVKTTITYGSTGVANNLLPTATTTAAGDGSVSSTIAVAYDMVGNKISEDGPLSGSADITTWAYNADRQLTQVVGPDPDGGGPLLNRSARTTYNILGQVTSVSTGTSNADGSGFVELRRADTLYDTYHRKLTQTVTAGGAIQSRADYSYDALERPSCSAVRMNPAVFASLSVDACTLGTQGSFGPDRITHQVYDDADRVVKVQTAYGTPLQRDETTYTYGTQWGSTIFGVTDAKGNLTTYDYDGWHRPKTTYYPSPTTAGTSSTTDYEQLTYDDNGHVTNRRLRDGKQISYTYDNLGRQTLAHMVNPLDANDRDIATSYDLLGRATQIDDGNGKKVSFAYDQLGRKLSEAPQLTGGSTTYQYDAGGRRTRLTWSDGFYVSYDYDTLGEMLAVRENGASSGVGVLATYTYDDEGKNIGLTRGNGVNNSYTYDAADRLSTYTISHPTAPNTYSFAYNPAGQMISRGMTNDAYAWTQPVATNRNYTTNGLNQYTASGTVVPTYDGRGNTTSAGPVTYTYDSKNQLNGFGANSLGYDAEGRLATQATPATRFVYDGSDLIAETDASNNILRRYVHIPGTDNVLAWYEGAGTTDRRWLAHDERMSTTLITDTSGASLAINTYDEYGNNTYPGSSGTTNLGRFQYTGQTWLPELGMYNYKARIYSPSMGRFMQTDSIGYGDGPNWYNYAHGDPVNGVDPLGLMDVTCTPSGCTDSKGNPVDPNTPLGPGDTVRTSDGTFEATGGGGGWANYSNGGSEFIPDPSAFDAGSGAASAGVGGAASPGLVSGYGDVINVVANSPQSGFQLVGLSTSAKIALCALVACTVQSPREGISSLGDKPTTQIHEPTGGDIPVQPEPPAPQNPSGPRVSGGTPKPMPPILPKTAGPLEGILNLILRFPLVIIPQQMTPTIKTPDGRPIA